MSNDQRPENHFRISDFLKDKIDSSEKSQKELSKDMGFTSPNFLSMLKNGYAKVPLDKVVVIAKALNIDPAYFMVLALEQFFPDRSDDVWIIFDRIVSLNEMELVSAVRAAYNNLDPAFTRKQIDEAIDSLVRLNPPRHKVATPNRTRSDKPFS